MTFGELEWVPLFLCFEREAETKKNVSLHLCFVD